MMLNKPSVDWVSIKGNKSSLSAIAGQTAHGSKESDVGVIGTAETRPTPTAARVRKTTRIVTTKVKLSDATMKS